MNGERFGALAAWDEAADILRRGGGRLVSGYFLCCLPFAVAALLTLDACLAGEREALPLLCLGLVATGYVRWLGGALLQRRAAETLDGGAAPPLAAFLPGYFGLRLRRQKLLAGPAAMDGGGAGEMLANANRAKRASPRLFRRLLATGALFWLVGAAQLFAVQYALVDLLLPFLFGFDDPLFSAVLFGRFWILALLMFSLLCFDCVWLIVGVVAYRRGASRWTGSDLLARIRAMEGGQ